MPTRVLLGWLAAALVLAAAPSAAEARQGAYRESAHGDRVKGVRRVPGARPGQCSHCHGAGPQGGAGPGERSGHMSLFRANDNALCVSCHASPRKAPRSWLGPQQFEDSTHAKSRSVLWPGGRGQRTRPIGDSGKCVNCHDPHGDRDEAGVIPSMLRARGAALCLTCHNGRQGSDVASVLTRRHRHPLTTSAVGSADAALVGAAGETCSACHNPHAAGVSRAGSEGGALAGVARVRPASALGGELPAVALSPSDTTAVRELEVCYRCHSAPPAGEVRTAPDIASKLSLGNASFHPVQARGRNAVSADVRTFVSPWGPGRLVTCSDCHASDGGLVRGPHASAYEHILKKPYTAGPDRRPPTQDGLCFDCHQFGVYAGMGGAQFGTSRFPSHGTHAALGYSCWSCHDAHGSAELPSLLVTRAPGLITFSADPAGGGTCTVSCHTTTPSVVSYGQVR